MKEDYMRAAIVQAEIAEKKDEVPVGAIVVKDGKIIAKAHNLIEKKQDATCHAEIIAIKKACKKLKSWRLDGAEMFVTLEPCPMCAGAIVNSRIRKVYFGARDDKNGAVCSVMQMFDFPFTHKPEFEGGVMEKECADILSDFFKNLRNNK